MDHLISCDMPHYAFVHREVRRVLDYPPRGTTRVRFVSRAFLHPHDERFRHVYLEAFSDDTGRFRAYEKNAAFAILRHSSTAAKDNDCDRDHMHEFAVTLPSVDLTLDDIARLHNTLPRTYILGFADCRHDAFRLMRLCYPLDT